jgi:hypothetical protein
MNTFGKRLIPTACAMLMLSTMASAFASEVSTERRDNERQEHQEHGDNDHRPAYKINRDEGRLNIKRSVDVTLDHRVNRTQLIDMANHIERETHGRYVKTDIGWRVNGHDNGVYWARTDYEPDLRVRIIGPSLEERDALVAAPVQVDGKVFGTWMFTKGSEEKKIVGYYSDDRLFLQYTYPDGTTDTREYDGQMQSGLSRLNEIDGDSDEYLIIDSSGNLDFWQGGIKTYSAPPL